MKEFSDNQKKQIEDSVSNLFEAIGDTTNRASTARTPERVVKAYQEIFAHTGETEFQDYTVFDSEAESDQVIVEHIPFYSICEHHLMPFFGTVDVAYIPDGKVIGLSKIPRLVTWASQRPSIQEDITSLVANQLNKIVGAKGVAVSINARHTCMEMRGINMPGTYTNTLKFLGSYKDDVSMQERFLSRIKK
jgi:GTP cyclohydrolase I